MSRPEGWAGPLDVVCPWCASMPGAPCTTLAAHPTTGRGMSVVTDPHEDRVARIEFGPVFAHGALFTADLLRGDQILVPEHTAATVLGVAGQGDALRVSVRIDEGTRDGDELEFEADASELWEISHRML